MKNWFKELKRKAKIRYLLEKYQHEETQRRVLRPIWPFIEKAQKISRKFGSLSWMLLRSGSKKLHPFGKLVVKIGRKLGSTSWALLKNSGKKLRSFGKVVVWPHVKKAVTVTVKKLKNNKLVAAIVANKVVIPVILGMAALSAYIAWQLLHLTDSIPSVPSYYWWIALGIAVAVPLLIWLAKAVRRRGGAASSTPAPTPTPAAATPTRTVVARPVVINTTGLFWSVALLAIVGLAVFYRAEIGGYLASRPVSAPRVVATSTPTPARLPADVALPIIADCESGLRNAAGLPIRGSAKQFSENGAIVQSETSDIGKYQIHLPDHWGRAEQMDIDLYTEEGNEKYARILYEENGTRDWNASHECWEPKLVALGHHPPDSGSFGIEAGTEWTSYINIVRPWGLRSEPIGVRYEVQVDNHPPIKFPVPNGEYVAQPEGARVRTRSLENEPIKLVMRWK